MSSDFSRVAGRLQRLSNDLDGQGLRSIVTAVAAEGKKDIAKEVKEDLGSDMKMSNWGRFRFNSGFELEGNSRAVILPRPLKPWIVLEEGRKGGHKIPKGRRKRKIYRTPWGPRTATREAPWVGSRSKGKNTMSNASREIERKTPQRVHEETGKVIAKHFTRGK